MATAMIPGRLVGLLAMDSAKSVISEDPPEMIVRTKKFWTIWKRKNRVARESSIPV